jgi:uncharacterized MAPEG superfamily protein
MWGQAHGAPVLSIDLPDGVWGQSPWPSFLSTDSLAATSQEQSGKLTMHPTGLTALLVFAALPVILMLTYVGYRVGNVLFGGKPADSWTRGFSAPVPGFFVRAQDAQLNCLENLPVFAVIVMAAHFLGRDGLVDSVAGPILFARVAQIATHLTGVSHWLVMIRATFFGIQAALFLYLIVHLLS